MKKLLAFTFLIGICLSNLFGQSYSIIPSEADTNQTRDILILKHSILYDSEIPIIKFGYRGHPVDITTNTVLRENDSTLRVNITVGRNVYSREYDIIFCRDTIEYEILWDRFHINGLPRPIIKSITPNKGTCLDTLDLTIIGENTHFKQAEKNTFQIDYWHNFDSIYSFNMDVINDTLITLKHTIPSEANNGGHNVYLWNEIDDYMWIENGFTVFFPWLSVTPSSVYRGDTINFWIKGYNTHFLEAANNTVILSYKDSIIDINREPVVINDTLITAWLRMPLGFKSDYCSFKVVNNVDNVAYFRGLNILPPSIDSIVPSKIQAGLETEITVYTKKTHHKSAADFYLKITNNILFYEFESNNLTVVNDTILKYNIVFPDQTYTDQYSVFLRNNLDEEISLIDYLSIDGEPKPKIKNITTPDIIEHGDTINMTIVGLNTHFTIEGFQIFFKSSTDTIKEKDFNSISIVNNTLIFLNLILDKNESVQCYDLIISDSLDGNLAIECAIHYYVPVSGIPNTFSQNSVPLVFFPNPVESHLTMISKIKSALPISIELYSITGAKLATILNHQQFPDGKILEFDMSSYQAGTYIVKIRSSNLTYQSRILIIKK
jgi:hypothetical protein